MILVTEIDPSPVGIAAVSGRVVEAAGAFLSAHANGMERPLIAILGGLALVAGFMVASRDRIRKQIARWRNRGQDPELVPGELAMLRAVVANLPEIVYVKDARSRFVLANRAAARSAGAASDAELLGKTDFDCFPKEIAEVLFESERKVLESCLAQVNKEELIRGTNGKTRHLCNTRVPLVDPAGKTIGLIGIGRDVTELKALEAELRRTREELAFKNTHDALTSLMNRDAILEQLELELARSAREHASNAVVLADLDNFGSINDVHGHLVGDEVLREVGRRLVKSVRRYDLVGRYGGEEFLVVMPGCSAAEAAMTRAEQLRDGVASAPIVTAHGPISVTISVGVLVTGEHRHVSAVDVILDVEAALDEAMKAGRNRCRFASPTAPVAIG